MPIDVGMNANGKTKNTAHSYTEYVTVCRKIVLLSEDAVIPNGSNIKCQSVCTADKSVFLFAEYKHSFRILGNPDLCR